MWTFKSLKWTNKDIKVYALTWSDSQYKHKTKGKGYADFNTKVLKSGTFLHQVIHVVKWAGHPNFTEPILFHRPRQSSRHSSLPTSNIPL